MGRLLAVCLLAGNALRAAGGEASWQTIPLPPAAAQLNHTAAAAATPAAAARLYAQAIRAYPSNGPALFGLGQALLAQERVIDGLKVFRRLNDLFPDDPDLPVAIADAIARLPDPRRATIAEGLGFAERATALRPGKPAAWHVLSVLRHRDGDYAAAAEAARRALELEALNPSGPEAAALYQQQEIACNDALSVFSPLE